MGFPPYCEMRLYARSGERLYINDDERSRFLAAAEKAPVRVQALCLALAYTGCRLSEALALRPAAIQAEPGIITIRSLKKRGHVVMREIPVPSAVARSLRKMIAHPCAQSGSEERLWPWSRTTAWRQVKAVMQQAGIEGRHASPKGLRHGYGVHAIRSGVQLNMLQKWLGHAAMSTTSIYANAIGSEERAVARRMWHPNGVH